MSNLLGGISISYRQNCLGRSNIRYTLRGVVLGQTGSLSRRSPPDQPSVPHAAYKEYQRCHASKAQKDRGRNHQVFQNANQYDWQDRQQYAHG